MKVKFLDMGHRTLEDLSSLESGLIIAALKKYQDQPTNTDRDKKALSRMIKKIQG